MVEFTHKKLNMPTTVLAIVNGMIGGSILVIPLTSLQAGWAYTLIVILITGLFSFYSCYIAIIHLGDQKDLDSALLRHFNGSKFLKIFYDFCVWIGLVLLLMLYFDLIVVQWQGLVPPYTFTYGNVLINGAVVTVWCLIMKFFDFGAHMMGYGIISIVGYLIFLIWVVAARPTGSNPFPAFGTGVAGFAAMMGSAFSIQGFFIPVLKEYPKSHRHVFILFLAYVIGTSAYYYIAYMGAFGILNRSPFANSGTIEQYFSTGQWQVMLLEGIYLVHLYSVFPQYMIVCKKRFFSMFGIAQTGRRRISIPELVFIVGTVAISLVFTIFQISIDIIIDINGAVLGFCFIYLLPSILHIKCTYFPRGKRLLNQIEEVILLNQGNLSDRQSIKQQRQDQMLISDKNKQIHKQIEIQMKEGVVVEAQSKQKIDKNQKKQAVRVQIQIPMIQVPNKQQRTMTVQLQGGKLKQKMIEAETGEQKQVIVVDYSYFYCKYVKPGLKRQIIEMSLLSVMFLFGIFIMVNGLYQVVQMIQNP